MVRRYEIKRAAREGRSFEILKAAHALAHAAHKFRDLFRAEQQHNHHRDDQ